ncbi:uncharacterized protein YALI1_C00827g [Yarrowia lipolytica]|uniref:Uncharacterized protein n=1 Tax=Yarrowia lipolytica TaxID=4952 RepID=A0A1D8N950_YARLL|nr:hypothetical protein YALI1_C00827g [Yarrowia lipolytica]
MDQYISTDGPLTQYILSTALQRGWTSSSWRCQGVYISVAVDKSSAFQGGLSLSQTFSDIITYQRINRQCFFWMTVKSTTLLIITQQ